MKQDSKKLSLYITQTTFDALERRQVGTNISKNTLINLAIDMFLRQSSAYGKAEIPASHWSGTTRSGVRKQ